MYLIYFLVFFFYSEISNEQQKGLLPYVSVDSIATFYAPSEFHLISEELLKIDSNFYLLLDFNVSQLPNSRSNGLTHGSPILVPDDFIDLGNIRIPKLYFYDDKKILSEIPLSFEFESVPSLLNIGLVKSSIKLAPNLVASFRDSKTDRVIIVEPYHIKDKLKITEMLLELNIEIITSATVQKSIMIKTDNLNVLNHIAKIDEVYYLHYMSYLDNLPNEFLKNYVPNLCSDDYTTIGLPLKYSPYSIN